jgi:hypothetical protein
VVEEVEVIKTLEMHHLLHQMQALVEVGKVSKDLLPEEHQELLLLAAVEAVVLGMVLLLVVTAVPVS